MICQSIINKSFAPNSFSYLEIGIGKKIQYNSVNTDRKICDDVNGNADYNKGSDDFFINYNGDKFDIIFIDGDHSSDQTIKDYNNSIKHINDNGFIFLHDLLPPDLNHCKPSLCGDSFQLLNYFVDNNYDYLTIPEDFGLTLIYNKFDRVGRIITTTYQELINKKINLISVEDMVRFIVEKKI